MIEVDALSRRFETTVALDAVTFQVQPGEIVGFLGPNGAGKSTAMKILTCTLAPSSGKVRVAGFDVTEEAMEVRRRVGFMPEHVPLYPDSTVNELLRFVADLKSVPANVKTNQLDEIVEQTGLQEVRDRLVGQLSKGFRQRVGLAQALVGDPPILILDEPTAGLDPHQIVEIRNLIREFQGQKTVLLSSHILNEVSLTCQRVLILHRGRLVAEEGPAALAQRQKEQQRIRVEWDGQEEAVRSALAKLPGVTQVKAGDGGVDVYLEGDPRSVKPELAKAVIAAGGQLQRLEESSPTLEDLFLQLTDDAEEAEL
ncbi:MAG: ABC transporter ATP-binding protein [bacterium]